MSDRPKVPPPDLTPRTKAPPVDLKPPVKPTTEASKEDQTGDANLLEATVETPIGAIETDSTKRLMALLIDGIVGGLIMVVLSVVHDLLGQLGFVAYLLLRDALPMFSGQSLGKMLLNLKAVSQDGRSLSGDWATSALRNSFLLIPFMEGIVFLLRKDKVSAGLRLGDDFAKTKTIVVAPRV